MKLQDLLKDIELGKVYTDKDRKPFKVNEDGHTDVPSAIRKLKLSIEDSEELIKKLESMDKESSLPAWWTDKITLASNYLNKSRDYLLNSELDEEKLTEKVNQSKVNQAFTKGVAAIRKISRSLSDDDNYAFIQKLEKWLNKNKAKYIGIDRR